MYVLLGMQLGFLKEPWVGLALIEPYTNDVVFVNHCCAVRASRATVFSLHSADSFLTIRKSRDVSTSYTPLPFLLGLTPCL